MAGILDLHVSRYYKGANDFPVEKKCMILRRVSVPKVIFLQAAAEFSGYLISQTKELRKWP